MKPEKGKESIFSNSKPRDIPGFWVPVVLGIITMVVIYKWFS